MRVRVKPDLVETFVGFYGNKRRRPGDEFTLVDAVSVDRVTSSPWLTRLEP